MLLKVLGAVDIIVALVLIFLLDSGISWKFFWVLGILMIAKSLMGMLKDFGGWIDVIAGAILLVSIPYDLPKFVAVIVGVLLIQKGVVSFL